jgi:sugar phosphate isomerase/epimerase
MQAGVQLYTLRDPLGEDLDGGLKRIADIGFRFVELAGLYGLHASELKEKLAAAGLTPVSSHNGLVEVENQLEQVVADAKTLGVSTVVVPWLSINDFPGRWEEVASRLNGVGNALAEHDIRLAYHNHDFEFREDNGVLPMEFLADHLDPENCGIELDLAWVKHAGHDPVMWIEKLGDQIDFLHLKDVTADGELSIVGQGTVDWDAVLAAAANVGIEAGFVEHDNPGDAFASITASIEFLRGKGVTA